MGITAKIYENIDMDGDALDFDIIIEIDPDNESQVFMINIGGEDSAIWYSEEQVNQIIKQLRRAIRISKTREMK